MERSEDLEARGRDIRSAPSCVLERGKYRTPVPSMGSKGRTLG